MSTLASAINAASSALNVQRTRLEVAVSNLANAESTHGTNGEPYRRRQVLVESEAPDNGGGTFGVRVSGIIEDQSPFQERFEPSHPEADENGMVKMPNVDVPEEMVDMLGAARAYQANLAAISLIRETVAKALELGRA
jgi:flagellar basal-body rod protein FlgC